MDLQTPFNNFEKGRFLAQLVSVFQRGLQFTKKFLGKIFITSFTNTHSLEGFWQLSNTHVTFSLARQNNVCFTEEMKPTEMTFKVELHECHLEHLRNRPYRAFIPRFSNG